MAAIVSAGTSGNWSATGTWAGGVVPGNGDTVTFADATHTITVDVDTTVGSSPATGGTAAIAWPGVLTGPPPTSPTNAVQLTVATGKVLTIRGDIIQGGLGLTPFTASNLTLSSGASLIFDPPTSSTYKHQFWYAANLICNGTTNNSGLWPDTAGGNHCTVKTSTRGGGAAYHQLGDMAGLSFGAKVDGALRTATFTDFIKWGNGPGGYGLLSCPSAIYRADSLGDFTITDCTFTTCNWWILAEPVTGQWEGNLTFSSNKFVTSTAITQSGFEDNCWAASIFGTPATGVRILGEQALGDGKGNSFDKQVIYDGSKNIKARGNYFALGVSLVNFAGWADDSYFDSNFVGTTMILDGRGGNNIRNCYLWNFDSIQWSHNAVATACIFESAAAPDFGIITSPTSGVKFFTCIFLSDGSGAGSEIVDCRGNFPVVMDHCLCWGGIAFHAAAIYLAEAGAAHAGDVTSARANIMYFSSSNAGSTLIAETGGASSYTVDAVTVARNNAFFNGTSGTCKYNSTTGGSIIGYSQLAVSNATAFPDNPSLGLDDLLAEDPGFVDSARKLGKWNNVVNGGTNSAAAAIAAIAAKPSLLTQATTNLRTWVCAGMVPTNQAYLNATYPGDPLTTDALGLPLNGTVGPLGIQLVSVDASLAVTLGPDTMVGSASFSTAASSSFTLSNDTFVGSATSMGGTVTASLIITLGADIFIGISSSLVSYVSPTRATVLPEDNLGDIDPGRATVIQ